MTDSIAVFAEYKFNYAKLNLETEVFDFQDSCTYTFGTKGTYSTNMIVGGFSFHFNSPQP